MRIRYEVYKKDARIDEDLCEFWDDVSLTANSLNVIKQHLLNDEVIVITPIKENK